MTISLTPKSDRDLIERARQLATATEPQLYARYDFSTDSAVVYASAFGTLSHMAKELARMAEDYGHRLEAAQQRIAELQDAVNDFAGAEHACQHGTTCVPQEG